MTRTETTARLLIDVPPDYWLSQNRTVPNHAYRRRIIDALHELTVGCALRQHLPAQGCRVDAHWLIHYPKGVGEQADAVNASPTTKACLDALVPRWLRGDSARYVRRETFERGPNLDVPKMHRVVLTLTEVAA